MDNSRRLLYTAALLIQLHACEHDALREQVPTVPAWSVRKIWSSICPYIPSSKPVEEQLERLTSKLTADERVVRDAHRLDLPVLERPSQIDIGLFPPLIGAELLLRL